MTSTPPQVHFDDVNVGDEIPTLTVTVDPTQMFFFSAATYNGHRIHYDRQWAKEVEGYPDIVVQGPLQAALLARAVTDWIGSAGTLVNYAVQNRASAFPGDELRFRGVVTAVRAEIGADTAGPATGLVDLEITGLKGDGQVLMPGTATVRLPRRG
ncbi:MaoC/PaaZ C-terminal domain-containing protein [Nakamurella lactea]|uniref:MaoC/PaaZ C-terminal domain-containing protein n=1 Tax=Nakamurella lactea TaxID=459515 RepID=UPI000425D7FF|nr:MaoC/PaaZ C-terminal domain-containing protein [Nakamurella lactea]